MASKVAVDKCGRRVVIATSCDIDQAVGEVVGVVIGDSFECVGTAVYFAADRARGRKPTAHEQAAARGVYYERRPQAAPPVEVDDELLADEAAIELARLEQERRPVDVVNNVIAA